MHAAQAKYGALCGIVPDRALGGVRHFMLVEATMWFRKSVTSGIVVLIATCTSNQTLHHAQTSTVHMNEVRLLYRDLAVG